MFLSQLTYMNLEKTWKETGKILESGKRTLLTARSDAYTEHMFPVK